MRRVLARTQPLRSRTLQRASTRAASSLREPLPGVPEPKYEPYEAKETISQLANGVTVVSVDTPTPTSKVAISVRAGPRNETQANAGVSQLLSNLSLRSTSQHSALELSRAIELSTAKFRSYAARDRIVYAARLPRQNVSHVVSDLMGPILASPRIQGWEVEDIQALTRDVSARTLTDPETTLAQEAYRTAFRSQGLGRDLYPAVDAPKLSAGAVRAFAEAHFVGPRVTVVGMGVDHDTLATAAEAGLGTLSGQDATKDAPSPYHGGESRLRGHSSSANTHVALTYVLPYAAGATVGGMPLVSAHGYLVQQLLGQGNRNAYALGGPGNGQASILGQLVTESGPIDWARSHFNIHDDAAVITVTARMASDALSAGVDALTNAVGRLAGKGFTEVEVGRTKAHVHHIMDEFHAYRWHTAHSYFPGAKVADAVSALSSTTAADLQQAAAVMVKDVTPTLVTIGESATLPSLNHVQANYNGAK